MGMVYLQACDLDGVSFVDVHADADGDVWIVTHGEDSVMLEPDSARKLAKEIIRLADQKEGVPQ